MYRILEMVGLKDNMPIKMKLISRQIEGAQKRIENVNFDYRKRVVDYDDVMNQHREIFYTRRREMLNHSEGANGRFLINQDLVEVEKVDDVNRKALLLEQKEEHKKQLRTLVQNLYVDEVNEIAQEVESLKEKGTKFEKLMKEFFVIVPVQYTEYLNFAQFNDKIKALTPKAIGDILSDVAKQAFEKKVEEFGDDFYYLAKVMMFQITDNAWVDHLEMMKDIRDGIGLQSYAQKDPLVEYKNEAFNVFRSFVSKMNLDFVKKILNVSKVTEVPVPTQGARQLRLDTNTEDIKDVSTEDREFVQTETTTNKLDSVIKNAIKQKEKTQATISTGESQSGRTIVNSRVDEIGRNDKVSVRYNDGKELKDVKYKKVEEDLKAGLCVLI